MYSPLPGVDRADHALSFRFIAPRARATRLLVLTHGVGGNETNLAAFASVVPDDTAIVLARGPLTIGPDQYAWFRVSFDQTGPHPDLRAAEHSRTLLATFIAQMQQHLQLPAERTVVAGFSQGGIMSASIGLITPDLVAGFGILAGRILPEIRPQIAQVPALAQVRAFIGHGIDDTKLPVSWATRAEQLLDEVGVSYRSHRYPGDHGVPSAMQLDFGRWFASLTGQTDASSRPDAAPQQTNAINDLG